VASVIAGQVLANRVSQWRNLSVRLILEGVIFRVVVGAVAVGHIRQIDKVELNIVALKNARVGGKAEFDNSRTIVFEP
jgi:hypothetical protein